MGVDVSAFDVKANEMGDLLMVKGGVEQYLQMVEGHMRRVPASAVSDVCGFADFSDHTICLSSLVT